MSSFLVRKEDYMRMFVLLNEMFVTYKIAALLCLIVANVLLGVAIAGIQLDFKKEVLMRGVLKHIAIICAIFLIYVAGCCIPDIQLVVINERTVTILEALNTGFLSLLAVYSAKVFKNLYIIFSIDTKNVVKDMDVIVSLPLQTELDDRED